MFDISRNKILQISNKIDPVTARINGVLKENNNLTHSAETDNNLKTGFNALILFV